MAHRASAARAARTTTLAAGPRRSGPLQQLLSLPRPGWERRAAVLLAAMGGAALIGASIPLVGHTLFAVVLGACVVAIAVAFHPPLAAYLLIGITPLVAGIDRGLVIPVLRPNEALLMLVGGILVARGIVHAGAGTMPRLRMDRTNLSILLLAIAASVIPLAWMLARGAPIAQDDILYALIPWKYYAVFLVVRASVRTEREVRNCLHVSMAAASLVAVIAIMQALQLFGVTAALASYYKPFGNEQALLNGRGGSTLSLPIAQADLMIFNLAIAVGFLLRLRTNRGIYYVLAGLFVAGVIASGEFSGAIGLVLAIVVLALVTRNVKPLAASVPLFAGAAILLRPVIEVRAQGFQTASGLPVSWAGRLHNLQSYFWPVLFNHGNFILGVRPAARVSTPTMATGYIWIESGYTWLLWGGGIPLLGAFLYFLWTNIRRFAVVARERVDAVGTAALAAVTGLAVIAVLMIFDPHLTYRGSADLLFALLALASVSAGERILAPDAVPSAEATPLRVVRES
jgi:hypothetical protein